MNLPMHGAAPLLAATGQSRRLAVLGFLAVIGFGCATLAPILYSRGILVPGLALFAAGCVLLLASVSIALRTVKCPACGFPWLRFAIGGMRMGNWWGWLYSFSKCPNCALTSATLRALPSSGASKRKLRK
jgi:hypothetical protein